MKALGIIAASGLWAAIAHAAPPPGATWDWQLTGQITAPDVQVFDTDPEAVDAAQIKALTTRGVYSICYVSVGTLEDFRDDVAAFPAQVIGRVYGDWPDERFLDIRALDILLPLMGARFQRCAAMGFAAIEPDNMDVHSNASGFPIRAADTVRYVRALADLAHGMGLQIGQENVPALTPALIDHMDFAITESCWPDQWCDQVTAYIVAGKPVFDAEYSDRNINWKTACAWAQGARVSMILKDRDLTRWRRAC